MLSTSFDSEATTEPTSSNIISPEIVTLIDTTREKLIDNVKAQLLEHITDQEVDKPLLFTLLIKAMEIIEISDVKGTQQKDIVIEILLALLESEHVKSQHKQDLILFLKHDATNVIDIIIDASKGKIDINKIETYTTKFVKCIFGCLKKKDENIV
tara:strand:+ start:352 stop:816 length:465 start_codon:yes stop_codon:yes gene_type:complete